MSVREIPRGEWEAFLEQFSRGHRAWLATVDRVGPDAARHVEILERPLGAVTPAVAKKRVVGIRIEFQEDSRTGAALTVDAPRALRVEEAAEGAARWLEIENARGQRTRIRFRVPPPPDMLDGVARGEL
jgi:hypothetical protein